VPDTVIGQPVGRLPIPKISILDAIVEGVGRPSSSRDRALPGTSLPGEDGNVAIAEHRST
jgi:sortase (surface protein transpeptidase)